MKSAKLHNLAQIPQGMSSVVADRCVALYFLHGLGRASDFARRDTQAARRLPNGNLFGIRVPTASPNLGA